MTAGNRAASPESPLAGMRVLRRVCRAVATGTGGPLQSLQTLQVLPSGLQPVIIRWVIGRDLMSTTGVVASS